MILSDLGYRNCLAHCKTVINCENIFMSQISNMIKSTIVRLAYLLIVLPRTAYPASFDINVLVCPEGCGIFTVDQHIAKLIEKEDTPIKYMPIETKGYLDNINRMGTNPDLWKNTIFANNDDTMIFAPQGGEHPFKKFIPKPVKEDFKLLYGFYWGVTGHFFITLNPAIKTIADLQGKKIGLGLVGQSDWGMNPTLDLEYGYGITEQNSELKYLGPALLWSALQKGEIDATVAALGTGTKLNRWLPSKIFSEVKKTKEVYYLGHDPSIIEKLNQQLNTAYIPVTMDVGTLPKQNKSFVTFADRDYKVAHRTFPEEWAYQLIKLVAKLGPRMMLSSNIWQTWSPEIMVAGLTEENAHPGAIRAFKELGWWELRKSFKPVMLPE